MTLDELFSQHNITAEEREQLVFYLIALRMQALFKELLPPTKEKQ